MSHSKLRNSSNAVDASHTMVQEVARASPSFTLLMVLAPLGRRKVAIFHKESVDLPSNIAGLIYMPFTERVDEVKGRLFQELRAAGINVQPSRSVVVDWYRLLYSRNARRRDIHTKIDADNQARAGERRRFDGLRRRH